MMISNFHLRFEPIPNYFSPSISYDLLDIIINC
jgi:hypothetical protein